MEGILDPHHDNTERSDHHPVDNGEDDRHLYRPKNFRELYPLCPNATQCVLTPKIDLYHVTAAKLRNRQFGKV